MARSKQNERKNPGGKAHKKNSANASFRGNTEPNESKMNRTTKRFLLLAGDIGGTNTRLALYCPVLNSNDTSNVICDPYPIYVKKYINEQYFSGSSADTTVPLWEHQILLPFLTDAANLGHLPTATDNENESFGILACLAVAGPVDTNKNRVIMTNIMTASSSTADRSTAPAPVPIVIDGNSIEASNHSLLQYIERCVIVNDFIGQGYGVLTLNGQDPTQIMELIPGSFHRIDPNGPKACVGAGTGLGQCYLVPTSNSPSRSSSQPNVALLDIARYQCFPSEGGHVDYAPRQQVQIDLLTFLKHKNKEVNRVSVERVISGRGLIDVYEFLYQQHITLDPNADHSNVHVQVHEQYEKAEDKGQFIGERANTCMKESHPNNSKDLCLQAMEIVMEAYGAEVGNAALKFLPTGGLYVTGGLTPKNINFIEGSESPFMMAYADKGRLSHLLKTQIPLFAVLEEDLGLRGAWFVASREFNRIRSKK